MKGVFGDCQFTCFPDCQLALPPESAKNLKEWGLKKTLDKVTSVANNPEAIGHKARHAVTKGTGSQVRMTFDQARAHVFKAVQKWIAHERDKPDAKNTDEQ